MELTIIILLLCYIILYFLRRPETTLRHNRESIYRLRVYFYIILREYNVDNEKKTEKNHYSNVCTLQNLIFIIIINIRGLYFS